MRAICRRYGVVPSILLFLLPALVLLVPAPASAATADDPYADPARWLCRPDTSDGCDRNLDATVVRSNGSTSVERWAPAADAPVDCFYLYPTTSTDWAANSDFVANGYEEYAARAQVARLGTQCRVFAPIYRQLTLTWIVWWALFPNQLDLFPADVVETAYRDVVAAFRHYLAADNGGRGFVLIGHSQGAAHLSRLLRDEVLPFPQYRSRMISVMVLGTTLANSPDPAVVPPCTAPTQTGCHIAFASFKASSPPAVGAFPGPAGPGRCVNPAALGGGRAVLRSYFPTNTTAWLRGRRISTPFVSVPGLVEGACVERNGTSYLEITVNGNPSDPRIDDIAPDAIAALGMHSSDVPLVMGDLVDLVGQQSQAYRTR